MTPLNCQAIAQMIGLTKPSDEWTATDYRLFQKAEEIEAARSCVVSLMQSMAERLRFAAHDLGKPSFWEERQFGGMELDLDKLIRSSLFDLERKRQELKDAIEGFYRITYPPEGPKVLEFPTDKVRHGGNDGQKIE